MPTMLAIENIHTQSQSKNQNPKIQYNRLLQAKRLTVRKPSKSRNILCEHPYKSANTMPARSIRSNPHPFFASCSFHLYTHPNFCVLQTAFILTHFKKMCIAFFRIKFSLRIDNVFTELAGNLLIVNVSSIKPLLKRSQLSNISLLNKKGTASLRCLLCMQENPLFFF